MSALASVINQPLQSCNGTKSACITLLQAFEFTSSKKPSSKAPCSCFLPVLQVFLNYLHSSGVFELAHIMRRKTLAGKQTWSRIRGPRHPLVPFAIHKRNKKLQRFSKTSKSAWPRRTTTAWRCWQWYHRRWCWISPCEKVAQPEQRSDASSDMFN